MRQLYAKLALVFLSLLILNCGQEGKALYDEGIQALKDQDYEIAKSKFEELVQKFPKNKLKDSAEEKIAYIDSLLYHANQFVREGDEFYYSKKFARALEKYRNAISILPKSLSIRQKIWNTNVQIKREELKRGVVIFVKKVEQTENIPTFTIKTNLPDSMEVMASLKCDQHNYLAQDKGIVISGEVTLGPFSDKSQSLPRGKYILEITTPAPTVQPKGVKEIIGSQGEFLAGKYVTYDPVWFNRVKYKQTFYFSGPVHSKKAGEILPSLESDHLFYFIRGTDNGYKWNRTVYEAKMNLCRDIARRIGRHNGQYYYECINEFFNTTDPNLLRMTIAEVAGLCSVF